MRRKPKPTIHKNTKNCHHHNQFIVFDDEIVNYALLVSYSVKYPIGILVIIDKDRVIRASMTIENRISTNNSRSMAITSRYSRPYKPELGAVVEGAPHIHTYAHIP